MNRREFNRIATIDHIKSVFLLYYEATGIEKINVNELCRQCGIAKSTFYLYFTDKYSILQSIEDDLFTELVAEAFDLTSVDFAVISAGKADPKAISTVKFLKKHQQEFRALLGNNGDPSFINKWKRYIVVSFQNKVKQVGNSAAKASVSGSLFAASLIELFRLLTAKDSVIDPDSCAITMGNLLYSYIYDIHKFISD